MSEGKDVTCPWCDGSLQKALVEWGQIYGEKVCPHCKRAIHLKSELKILVTVTKVPHLKAVPDES